MRSKSKRFETNISTKESCIFKPYATSFAPDACGTFKSASASSITAPGEALIEWASLRINCQDKR